MVVLCIAAFLFASLPDGVPDQLEPVFVTEGVLFADVLSDSELLCILTENGVISPVVLNLETGSRTPWVLRWEPEHDGWFMGGYSGLGVSQDGQNVFISMSVTVPGEFDHGHSNTDLIIHVVSDRQGTNPAPVALGMSPVGGGRSVVHFTPDSRYIVGNNILSEYMYPEAYASYLVDTRGHFPRDADVNAWCIESGTTVLIPFSRRGSHGYSLGPSHDYRPSASGRYFAIWHNGAGRNALSFGDWLEGSSPGEAAEMEEGSSVNRWLGDIGIAVSRAGGYHLAFPDGTLADLPEGFEPGTARQLLDGTWLFTSTWSTGLEHATLDGNTLQILTADTISMEGLPRSPIILPLPGSGAVVISGTRPYQLWHLRPAR